MGILHVRPKWIKEPKRKRSANRRKSSAGLRIERNRDGILFFRQPHGMDEFTTWHIYPSGEAVLRGHGITEGMILRPGLFKKLRDGGHLYTGEGKTAVPLRLGQLKRNSKKLQSPSVKTSKRQDVVPPQKMRPAKEVLAKGQCAALACPSG